MLSAFYDDPSGILLLLHSIYLPCKWQSRFLLESNGDIVTDLPLTSAPSPDFNLYFVKFQQKYLNFCSPSRWPEGAALTCVTGLRAPIAIILHSCSATDSDFKVTLPPEICSAQDRHLSWRLQWETPFLGRMLLLQTAQSTPLHSQNSSALAQVL